MTLGLVSGQLFERQAVQGKRQGSASEARILLPAYLSASLSSDPCISTEARKLTPVSDWSTGEMLCSAPSPTSHVILEELPGLSEPNLFKRVSSALQDCSEEYIR